MKHAAYALALLACPTIASAADVDSTPPKEPTGSVYAGTCLSPALNAPDKPQRDAGFFGGLAVSAGSFVLGKAFDWVGDQLTRLGNDERTEIAGTRTSEAAFSDHYCVQIVRYSQVGTTISQLIRATPAFGPPNARPYRTPAVPLGRPVDFFAEFWARPSIDGAAISFTPTLLYYPSILGHRNGKGDTTQLVTIKAGPPGGHDASYTWPLPRNSRPSPGLQVLLSPASPEAGAGGMKIYRLTASQLSAACESECEGSSPWLPNPWQAAAAETKPSTGARASAAATPAVAATGATRGGHHVGPSNPGHAAAGARRRRNSSVSHATTNAAVADATTNAASAKPAITFPQQPTNIEMTFTEIRSGSKFWKALADFWNSQKSGVQTHIQQAIFEDQRQQAEANNSTTNAQLLSTYSEKITEAATALDQYCAAGSAGKANWSALSASLRAKQLAANAAAIGAHQPLPFGSPIAVSASIEPGRCP